MSVSIEEKQQRVMPVIWAMAAIVLAVHLVVNLAGGYGFFRDELYMIACSEHLDAGYVDHPPLSVLILALFRLLFGSSLFAVRLPVALAAAGAVVFTGLIVRELGGQRRAAFFACLAVLVSPVHLGITNIFSMNAFDVLVWPVAGYLLLRIVKSGRPADWLLLGLLLGLGLLNKTSVLWLGAGIGLAVVTVSRLRRQLRTPWPYAAAAIALLLFSPFVIWNAAHGFPHLEFMHNAIEKYASQTPATFLSGVVMIHHPLTVPLWLGGFLFLLLGRADDDVLRSGMRALFVVFATVLAILLINFHSKPEYLTAAMALVFAGGGLAVERLLDGRRRRKLAAAYAVLLILAGVFTAPMVLPILPVDSYVAYARFLGIGPSTAESHKLADLPQFYADMFGWEQKAQDVARVYNSLSQSDRSKCAIFARNYGRCGAIDYFGPRYGLPRSIGGHNSYWLWGPRNYTGDLVIVLGGEMDDLKQAFESVEIAGVSTCQHCIPYENNLPIYICRGSKKPLPELWASTKEYG